MSQQMVPLEDLHENPDNPRTTYDAAALKELAESIKSNGIITPLVVWPRANGGGESDGYVILAGHRRSRAAKLAGLTEVPVTIPEGQFSEGSLVVADNVIRADLTPLEEARAYQKLVTEGVAKGVKGVSMLVGRNQATVKARLALLDLPELTQQGIDAGLVPLGMAPNLIVIAGRDARLCDLVATWLAQYPVEQSVFASAPAEVVDRVLDEPSAVSCVAYSAGNFRDPILPRRSHSDPSLPYIIEKLGAEHGARVKAAYDELEDIGGAPDVAGADWELSQKRSARDRACFTLIDEDVDAARAYGCLLELVDEDEDARFYLCDADFVATCLVKRIEEWAPREAARFANMTSGSSGRRERPVGDTQAPDEEQAAERKTKMQAEYEARQAARARNLDVGAKVMQTEFDLDLAAAKFLCGLALDEYGAAAVMAWRLCEQHPVRTAKATGRETVQYPRGGEARELLLAKARKQVAEAKGIDQAWQVVARLLAAQHLVDVTGLPGVDREGVYEPIRLQRDGFIKRLAKKATPQSVRKHLSEQAKLEKARTASAPTGEGPGTGDSPDAP